MRVDGGSKGGKMISRLSFTNQSATKRDDTVKKNSFFFKKKKVLLSLPSLPHTTLINSISNNTVRGIYTSVSCEGFGGTVGGHCGDPRSGTTATHLNSSLTRNARLCVRVCLCLFCWTSGRDCSLAPEHSKPFGMLCVFTER